MSRNTSGSFEARDGRYGVVPPPGSCLFAGCGLPLRMRYPGGDPENGPARPTCREGHSVCELCSAPIGHQGCCDPCLASQPDCDCPTVANAMHPDGIETRHTAGCPLDGPPHEFFYPYGGPPATCDVCHEEITEDQNMVHDEVEDCSTESGPTGRLVQIIRHIGCQP